MAEDNGALLESLLGMLGDNPEEKIAQALSGLTDGTKKEPEQENAAGPDLESLLSVGSLLSGLNENDDRACLLNALKPFLSEEKRPRVDSAVKLLRLVKVAEAAGKTDLFKLLK